MEYINKLHAIYKQLTNMGYEQYDWFTGSTLSGPKAELFLNEYGKDGNFVVRISSTKKYYVLTMFCKGSRPRVSHHNIMQSTSGKFYLEADSETFSSLPGLISHLLECKHGLPCQLRKMTREAAKPATRKTAPIRTAARVNVERNTATVPVKSNFMNKCICSWEIGADELKIVEKIGNGSFGVVNKGILRKSATVAVKTMIKGSMAEDEFIKEAHIMTELKHPHIVRLCGIGISSRPIFIVTEYMSHGSLLNYLAKNFDYLKKKEKSLISICVQVADGMSYLEKKGFVHRDLACRNCLVGDNGIVKVTDFGMSKFMSTNVYHANQQSVFAMYSAAPEVMAHRRFSTKSDVWAFGLMMWEVFSGGYGPFGTMGITEIKRFVGKGYILDKPRVASHAVYEVMSDCWYYTPESRPGFATLYKSLMRLVK